LASLDKNFQNYGRIPLMHLKISIILQQKRKYKF